MSDLYVPELMFYAGSSLLESPRWLAGKNLLLCVSIEQECIYSIDITKGHVRTYTTDGQVGCVVCENENQILSAEYKGIYRIFLDSGIREYVTQCNLNEKLRYNDGILDPEGRFLVGTTGYNCLAEKQNALYSWDGEKATKIIDNTTISNGIAFSPDGNYMYFVDSPTNQVCGYYYERNTGEVIYDRIVVEIKEAGMPDGICMDIDGNLWVAHWEGGLVSKWNPENGEKIKDIRMPCQNVTACCIGGENKEFMFVTTGKNTGKTQRESLAGGLFRIRLR